MDKITKTYYINLNKRIDRNKHLINEFKKIKYTNYIRVEASETQFGGLGCCQSHLAILNHIRNLVDSAAIDKNNKLNHIYMIVEDDAVFALSRETIDKYVDAFINDPIADVLCLDYNVRMFCDYIKDDNVDKLFNRGLHTCSTCCYIIKGKSPVLQKLIDCFNEAEKGLLTVTHNLDPNYSKYAIDQYWKYVQMKTIFLLPKERCVYQYTNYSDISNNVQVRYI